MMQTERKQQTLKCTVNKRCKDRRSISRVSDPYSKRVDSKLNDRPYDRQYQADHDRPGDHDKRYKTFPVEEGQCIRQFAEIVVFIVNDTAHEAGDHTDKYAHVQSRSAQYRCKVAIHGDRLSEQCMGHRCRISQHIICDPEDLSRNIIDQDKCDRCRKCAAGTLFGPRTADRDRKEQVQVVDNGPADIFNDRSDRADQRNIASRHADELS